VGLKKRTCKTVSGPGQTDTGATRLISLPAPLTQFMMQTGLIDLMDGLVPELKPTCVDRFGGPYGRDGSLELGKLYFDEVIGTATLHATVNLSSADLSVVRSGALAQNWTTAEELALQQRTWVRLFPNEGHALDAARGNNQWSIPARELGKKAGGYVVAELYQAPALGHTIELTDGDER
jgi:hypothetical protein